MNEFNRKPAHAVPIQALKKSVIHLNRRDQLANPQTQEVAIWACVRLIFRPGVNGSFGGRRPRGRVLGDNGENTTERPFFLFSLIHRLSYFCVFLPPTADVCWSKRIHDS